LKTIKPKAAPKFQDFDFLAWGKKCEKLIKKDVRASRSWKYFERVEMHESLPVLLCLSCDFANSPGYGALEWLRTEGLKIGREKAKLAKRLDEDLKALQKLDIGDGYKNLLQDLEKLISELSSSAKELREALSLRSLKPSLFLAWLISDVEEKTGKPNYRDIANVLEMAYLAHGQEAPEIGEDAIRKGYKRFQKENPFAKFLTPTSKRTIIVGLVMGLVILLILHLSASGKLSTLKELSTTNPQPFPGHGFEF
jgi:hypothetical protein